MRGIEEDARALTRTSDGIAFSTATRATRHKRTTAAKPRLGQTTEVVRPPVQEASVMARTFQIPSITPALLWAVSDAVIAGLDAIELTERRRPSPLYGIAAPSRGRSASLALATGMEVNV